jgi:hypothetical protein
VKGSGRATPEVFVHGDRLMGVFPLDHPDARRVEALVPPVLVAHGACAPAWTADQLGQRLKAQLVTTIVGDPKCLVKAGRYSTQEGQLVTLTRAEKANSAVPVRVTHAGVHYTAALLLVSVLVQAPPHLILLGGLRLLL